MKNIIGLAGKMQAGKNTVERIIHCLMFMSHNPDHYAKEKDIPFLISDGEWNKMINPYTRRSGWQSKSFAYKVKQVCSLLTGLNTMELDTDSVKRSFLSDEWNYNAICKSPIKEPGCGKMSVREMLQFIGTDCMRNQLHPNTWVNALYSDYVYSNGVLPKWIITDVRFPNEAESINKRDGLLIRVNRESAPKNDHASETSLDNYEFSHVINNNGSIYDLVDSVKTILINERII